MLFDRHLGARALAGKGIQGGQLRDLLHHAGLLQARQAERVLQTSLRAHHTDRQTLGTTLGLHGLRQLEWNHAFARGGDVLGRAACSSLEIRSLRDEIARVRGEVQALADRIGQPPSPDSPEQRMLEAVQELIAALDARDTSLVTQAAQLPDTAGNVRPAFHLLYDAAIKVANDVLAQLPPQDPRRTDAQTLIADLTREKGEALQGMPADAPVSKAHMDAFEKLPRELNSRLFTALTGKTDLGGALHLPKWLGTLLRKATGGADFAKALHRAHVEGLNAQAWNPIQRAIPLYHSGRRLDVQSEIIPEAHLNPTMIARRGGHGITCADTSSQEAVNVAQVRLSVPGPHGPRTLFQALRHGVHSAFGLPAAQRPAANQARVRQMYTDALCMHPDLLQRALAGNVVDLPIVSVGLLTPDGLRGDPNDEKAYLLEQKAAWMEARDPGQEYATLHIQDPVSGQPRAVRVRPQVAQFNFGVNEGAQQNALKQAAVGGWGTSTRINEEALQVLLGDVRGDTPDGMLGAYLARRPVPANRDTVLRLYGEIRELWSSGAYRQKGEDPYRLPARIAVLADQIGATPAFNCKSGKDRTGQMHVACANLAVRLEMGLPTAPGRTPGADDRHLLEELALNSGNHEMQRLNTGLAGFKTKHVSGLDAAFRPEAVPLHRGLSDYVHA